nr:MAG TPA: hypothetical protein [Bacteriophage sp.]
MIIKRKLWYVKAEGLAYHIVAESFDEAIQLIKIWRPDAYIEEVRVSPSDSIVIVKEDMDEVIKERKGHEAH